MTPRRLSYAWAAAVLLGLALALAGLKAATLHNDVHPSTSDVVLAGPVQGPAAGGSHESAAGDTHEGTDTIDTGGPPVFAANLGVHDQVSDGLSMTVADAEVGGSPGWVVVQRDAGGKPGAVLGKTRRLNGEHGAAFAVRFVQRIPTGKYWVTLHRDLGKQRVFEFPGPDEVAIGAGSELRRRVLITVH